MANEAYRTDDMALATVLCTSGYEYSIEMLTRETALWSFTIPEERSEEFDALVADYDAFEASVEPRKFMATWTEMRKELFRRMPSTRRAANRRSASAS